jgi:DNA primase
LPIDKNKMLNCPFHEDKTASLQVNLQKNLYKCHACGKKGDQIQFVQDYEKITKHEALNHKPRKHQASNIHHQAFCKKCSITSKIPFPIANQPKNIYKAENWTIKN